MVLLLTIASLIAWADGEPGHLPGSELSLARAKLRALYITEARIIHLGGRRPYRPRAGGLEYPAVVIEPSKAIKGVGWWGPQARPKVGLLLTQNDTVPREGEVYVLYIEQMGRGLDVFKVTRPDGAIPAGGLGSGISLTEAEETALYVIEAKIQDPGRMERDPDRPPRGLIYPRVLIEPSRVIKGVDKAVALAIREVRVRLARDETPLEKGKTYTLYLRETDRGFEIFRVTQRSDDRPARLPGSGVSVAEAEREALYIAEGRILRLGELEEDRTRPHGLVYPLVPIEQSRVIKGRHEGFARSRRDVRLLLTEDEAIPNEGQTYIFYVRSRDRGFEVFKVMPGPSDRSR